MRYLVRNIGSCFDVAQWALSLSFVSVTSDRLPPFFLPMFQIDIEIKNRFVISIVDLSGARIGGRCVAAPLFQLLTQSAQNKTKQKCKRD